ncbi:MAG: BamA/TamA family outer membrane protein [Gammaproteobacteria bacterium]|nr:BamA/TamA family outer membrane protein [Gammaproteobacteria bacterium]
MIIITISQRLLFQRLLIASVLLCHSLWLFADSKHPNKQALTTPDYTEDSDQSFTLPPVDTSPLKLQSQAEPSIQIKQVEYIGNSVFTDSELQTLIAPYLNKPVTANDLGQLSFIVSQYYSQHGYVNSGAYLPEQDLLDGVLTIQIIEGRLTDIQVNGQGWLHPDYIRNRLLDNKPLNVNSLQERYLLLLNDPLISKLNGALKPTAKLGESQLDLSVTRAPSYGLSVSGNNYRAPSIGAEQFVAHGWARNLTRWGDLIDFSFGLSEGSKTYAGGLSLPLNSSGTLFDFHFDLGDTSVIEEPLNNANIDSEVENFSWTLSHPFYRSLDHTVILGTSFATRRNQTTLLGQDFSFVQGLDTGKTRVSVIRVFQEYLGRFEKHVFAFRSTFNIGIDALGSTIQSDDNLPDSEYFSWLGQFQYAFKVLENGAQIKTRGNVQLSDETLLPQERISIGGVSTVRGYRENELVRDQGFSVSLEFHYPLIGQVAGDGHKLVIIPFMDYGSAWNKDDNTDNLHSVGIGLHWQPIRYIQADFFYGYDIKKARDKSDYNLQDDGIHFNLTLSSF